MRRYSPRTRTRTTFKVVPDSHPRGKGLAAQGFHSGHTVDSTCEDGKLVITPSERQRFAGV